MSRTKMRLAAAIITLLEDKRWDKISVQDLIDEADVGRSTFYVHYESKLDLLLDLVPTLVMPLSRAEPDGMPDLVPLFEHIRDKSSAIRPVMSQSIRGEVTDAIHRQFVSDWQRVLQHRQIDSPMAAEFLAGATVACSRWYLDHLDEKTPSAVAQELATLAEAVLSGSSA